MIRVLVRLLEENKSLIRVSIKHKEQFSLDIFPEIKTSSRFYYCSYNQNVTETCKFIEKLINKNRE
jgi:hypothetical protein